MSSNSQNDQNKQLGQVETSHDEKVVASYIKGMKVERKIPNQDSRNMDEPKYWNYNDVVINPNGEGVPDEIFLEDHFLDRQSELIYNKMKAEALKANDVSSDPPKCKSQLPRVIPEDECISKVQISAEKLARSKGRKVYPRHIFRVVRQHVSIRKPEYEKSRYQGDRSARTLRGSATFTLTSERAQEYSNYTLIPEEVCHLFRILETRRRLTLLERDDVQRKEWFLHNCRRTWETSGFKVLGLATTRSSFYNLKEQCGIETMPFYRLNQMINPTIPFKMQHRAQKLASHITRSSVPKKLPLTLSKNTILIVDSAERLRPTQLEDLFNLMSENLSKLLLVEGKECQLNFTRDTAFHDVAQHLKHLMPEDAPKFYQKVAQKLIQKPRITLAQQQKSQSMSIDL